MRFFKGFLILVFFLAGLKGYATHLRAGEILAENINNSFLQWRFTVILYTDNNSPVVSNNVDLNFGDNSPTVTVSRSSDQDLGNGTTINIYDTVHTFPSGVGVEYIVSVVDENRNAGVLNFDNSVNTAFYVQTKVFIDAAAGLNSSPRFTQIPVVNAANGQKWIFDNGGYDPDGDSISYELTVPKMAGGGDVVNYRDPDVVAGGLNEAGTAPAFFEIDPATGVITWDAPNLNGFYNIAFRAIEWRKNIFTGDFEELGYVTRDMQIVVSGIPNRRPLITAPTPVCVVAGSSLEIRVLGVDQDAPPNNIFLSASGEPFEVPSSFATFSPPANQALASPGTGLMRWNTLCSHIRNSPYRATFRVDDDVPPGQQLTDFASSDITVLGPQPQLDTAIIGADYIDLRWSSYSCPNATRMEIYRKVGPGDSVNLDDCSKGAPLGYEYVNDVDINTLSFRDNNGGLGLLKGPEYCYVLVATFLDGAISKASNEKCATLRLDVPFFTKVDVSSTKIIDGEIEVNWAKPIELDSSVYAPPYSYELFRIAEGNETQIYMTTDLDDTTFLDQNINTVDTNVFYRLDFYTDGGDSLRDPRSFASSAFLSAVPGGEKIQLSWNAFIPWNYEGLYHLIYRRDTGAAFQLIDSVRIEGDPFEYLDRGTFNGQKLENGREYCYYIETRGSYFTDKYPSILINRSQIKCEIPRDSIPPCPPILSIESINCDSLYSNLDCSSNPNDIPQPLANKISWVPDLSSGCDTEIEFYNIYTRRRPGDPYVFLEDVGADTISYDHTDGNLANCYVVTAIDSFGNESNFSNEVCNDNCPYFRLPNTFTPNGDAFNETFRACPEPRFVEEVLFRVYNRWGALVAEVDDDIRINWDGSGDGGNKVPPGHYFYEAQVRFARLREEDELEFFKGYLFISY